MAHITLSTISTSFFFLYPLQVANPQGTGFVPMGSTAATTSTTSGTLNTLSVPLQDTLSLAALAACPFPMEGPPLSTSAVTAALSFRFFALLAPTELCTGMQLKSTICRVGIQIAGGHCRGLRGAGHPHSNHPAMDQSTLGNAGFFVRNHTPLDRWGWAFIIKRCLLRMVWFFVDSFDPNRCHHRSYFFAVQHRQQPILWRPCLRSAFRP